MVAYLEDECLFVVESEKTGLFYACPGVGSQNGLAVCITLPPARAGGRHAGPREAKRSNLHGTTLRAAWREHKIATKSCLGRVSDA